MNKIEHMELNLEHSVEVPELDSQHKELVSFFNEALTHCSTDKAEERNYFDKVIENFISALTKHFGKEEQLLSGEDYDLYDKHKLEHTKLLEKVNFITQEIQNGKFRMNLFVLTTTLKDWFMFHLSSYDLNAKEYFRAGNAHARESVAV